MKVHYHVHMILPLAPMLRLTFHASASLKPVKNALKAPTCTCTYILMAETHSCSTITLFFRFSLVQANN
jgi:hypothetical protein